MNYRQVMAGIVIGLIFGIGVTAAVAQDDKNENPALVIHEGVAPTRSAPNGKASIKLLAEGKKAFVGKLTLAGNGSVPKHRDKSEEYIYILQGQGKLTINGKTYEVKPGSAVYMPAGAEVSYKNGAQRLVALQVFAGPESANKYSKWNLGQPRPQPGAQPTN